MGLGASSNSKRESIRRAAGSSRNKESSAAAAVSGMVKANALSQSLVSLCKGFKDLPRDAALDSSDPREVKEKVKELKEKYRKHKVAIKQLLLGEQGRSDSGFVGFDKLTKHICNQIGQTPNEHSIDYRVIYKLISEAQSELDEIYTEFSASSGRTEHESAATQGWHEGSDFSGFKQLYKTSTGFRKEIASSLRISCDQADVFVDPDENLSALIGVPVSSSVPPGRDESPGSRGASPMPVATPVASVFTPSISEADFIKIFKGRQLPSRKVIREEEAKHFYQGLYRTEPVIQFKGHERAMELKPGIKVAQEEFPVSFEILGEIYKELQGNGKLSQYRDSFNAFYAIYGEYQIEQFRNQVVRQASSTPPPIPSRKDRDRRRAEARRQQMTQGAGFPSAEATGEKALTPIEFKRIAGELDLEKDADFYFNSLYNKNPVMFSFEDGAPTLSLSAAIQQSGGYEGSFKVDLDKIEGALKPSGELSAYKEGFNAFSEEFAKYKERMFLSPVGSPPQQQQQQLPQQPQPQTATVTGSPAGVAAPAEPHVQHKQPLTEERFVDIIGKHGVPQKQAGVYYGFLHDKSELTFSIQDGEQNMKLEELAKSEDFDKELLIIYTQLHEDETLKAHEGEFETFMREYQEILTNRNRTQLSSEAAAASPADGKERQRQLPAQQQPQPQHDPAGTKIK